MCGYRRGWERLRLALGNSQSKTVWGAGRLRIVWVKANKLLPLHSGGDIRSYNILCQLAKDHAVTLLSYYDGSPDPAYEQELAKHFPEAVCVCTGKSDSRFARAVDFLRRVPHPAPFSVARFTSSKVRAQLRNWFDAGVFDVAVCDFLDAAVNFPLNLRIPSVLFQHNVESEIWRRHALTETNPLKKPVYQVEFRKMLEYEQTSVGRFHHVVAVSEHDRDLMKRWVAESRITVVPTGVDLQQYRPDANARELEGLVAFVGAMDWEPNVDAVEYFCNEIWPLVLAEIPSARFRIVGRNPDRRVQRFASNSVEVTGRVASVVDHLRQTAVVVVPLRVGGGTRLKIYEAMATGKAVVSTTVGAEGLDVHEGRDIILADTSRSFADAIITLLRDSALRRRLEQSASELAAQYDWSSIGRRFGQVLEGVARQAIASTESYQVAG